MLYTFCILYTFYAGRPYVRAKSGLVEDFSQNIFPKTPPEKCTGGGGPRGLPECVFKVGENSPPLKWFTLKIFGKINIKIFQTAYLAFVKKTKF
jgi:hypothetical protein